MNFSKNLRHLRKLYGYSQTYLADVLGYKNFTTVQKWEDGTAYPQVPTLVELSKIFNVSLSALLEADLTIASHKVPILGSARAGYDANIDNEYLGYEYVLDDETNGRECFYIKVEGDSMKDARINEGDLLLIERRDYLDNGDIGLFVIDNEESTIKKFEQNEEGIILHACNDSYTDKVFTQEDVATKRIQILGKVIHNKIIF